MQDTVLSEALEKLTPYELEELRLKAQAEHEKRRRQREAKIERLDVAGMAGFFPKQLEASQSALDYRFTMYGGARGPGKSYWLRWWLIDYINRLASEYGLLGVRVMLATEDYPSLWERQIVKIEQEFPSWLGRLYTARRREFVLDKKYGGGVIALRNLDEPSKYQSAEFAAVAVDQVEKNPERTFHILRGSMRWPALPEPTRFVSTANPTANWVRRYWLEDDLPEEMAGKESDFNFVKGLPDDNPHLSDDYWDELDTLPGALRLAWRYGDWYATVEGLVYDDFNDENIVSDEPDPRRAIELAVDDGYVDPRAILFIQRYPTHILVFDEIYKRKQLEEDAIIAIQDKIKEGWPLSDALKADLGIRDDHDAKVLSERGDLWPTPELAAVSHEAVSLRRRLRMANIPARNWMSRKVGAGQSTRVEAIKHTRSLIRNGKGYRTIRVHKRCRNLLNEITTAYKYPEGNRSTNEKPLDQDDHACQALEGWCWLRVKISQLQG